MQVLVRDLDTLVYAAKVGQSNGAYSLEDASLVLESIHIFEEIKNEISEKGNNSNYDQKNAAKALNVLSQAVRITNSKGGFSLEVAAESAKVIRDLVNMGWNK